MGTQLPIELLSNVLSMGLIIYLFYRYFQYKKKLDVIKGLDELKEKNSLTSDDLEFIKQNEKEYKEKLVKTEYNLQVATPVFILIAGALVLLLPFSEAAIHLNVVIVAFIVMQIDKLHKKNIHGFLKQLKDETKEKEPK
jgi:C4-dicarboxylate transporter